MAKGARASTRKANNVALKSRVFGPVEDARTQRLSAKLLELAQQPKKKDDVSMEGIDGSTADSSAVPSAGSKKTDEMEIDQGDSKTMSKRISSSRKVEKRRASSRKASIVFPKFKNGKRVTKSRGKK